MSTQINGESFRTFSNDRESLEAATRGLVVNVGGKVHPEHYSDIEPPANNERLETTAVILALAYLLLAMRQNRLCWIAAFVSALYTGNFR